MLFLIAWGLSIDLCYVLQWAYKKQNKLWYIVLQEYATYQVFMKTNKIKGIDYD